MAPEADLVTGDAVVLELRLARLASRTLAAAIDAAIQLAVLFIGLIVVVAAGPDDTAASAAILLTLLVLVRVGYPLLFETLSRGRTPGKSAFGLRAVRDDGGPIRFRHALTRALTGAIVDFGPLWIWGAVAAVTSLVSDKSKRVGDFLAGTVVVLERTPAELTPTIATPPPLLGWASRLELSAISDDLALAIRQYLARWQSLRPEAREDVGAGLAREVEERIGEPVPPGVPVWAYLMAVLAERRDRASRGWEWRAPENGEQGPFAPPG